MAITLTVNNKDFSYPQVSEEPGWGEDATGWAQEVTEVLESLAGPNDILQTTFTINNNISLATDIAGLLFNTAQVRAAFISYSLYRTTGSPSGSTAELAESGIITIVYKSFAATWNLTQVSNGNAGVSFSVTNTGQVQYTSTNVAGTNYAGIMRFEADTLL